ncbi:MAG: hypothetical protein HYT94_05530 [Parcubacteria group bacterium]|nr:hypothetical protein [Parcubacteria group bacterium]
MIKKPIEDSTLAKFAQDFEIILYTEAEVVSTVNELVKLVKIKICDFEGERQQEIDAFTAKHPWVRKFFRQSIHNWEDCSIIKGNVQADRLARIVVDKGMMVVFTHKIDQIGGERTKKRLFLCATVSSPYEKCIFTFEKEDSETYAQPVW